MEIKHPKGKYREVYQEAVEAFKKSDYCYGIEDQLYHTLKIFNLAKLLSRKVDHPHSKESVLMAALLHDIGKTKHKFKDVISSKKERQKHAEEGIPMAEEILKGVGYGDRRIKKICRLIRYHDVRDKKEKSTELKIIQDADLLAALGIWQFVRPFMYNAQLKRPVFATVEYFKHGEWKSEANRDIFNFKVSWRLGKELIERCERLVSGFTRELNGNFQVFEG